MQWKFAHRDSVERAIEAVIDNGSPRAALLGPAGVGKTMLARQFADRCVAARPGLRVHRVLATGSARGIPFGAVSHLIEVVERSDPTATLRAARATLCPEGSDVLLVVDDAHLLDAHSATLIHQLVVTASAQVVLTCRSGEAIPDAIVALWKDDSVTRVDIAPFTQAETTQLVEDVLGGSLDDDAATRIFTLSQGNPLFLRHLVEGAVSQGSFRRAGDTWRFTGETPLTQQLAELIDSRLSGLPSAVQTALGYLAVEEPLAVSVLASLTSSDAVEAAEEQGAVRVEQLGSSLAAFSGHPLFVERMRQSLGSVSARRLRTDIVRLLGTDQLTNVSDRLRIVALALDSDLPPRPFEVVMAAYEALYLNDLPLTEHLARAAVERADSAMSRVALAQALSWQGRGQEAEATLNALDPATLNEFELPTWILSRATNQFWMLGQATEASTWLAGMRSRLTDEAARLTVDALASQFAMNLGQLDRCMDLATGVLAADTVTGIPVAWAASSAAIACARAGDHPRVEAYAVRCLQSESPDGVRYSAALAQIQVAVLQGRVDDAVRIASRYLESAGFRPGQAVAQTLLAHALIMRGDPAGAERAARVADVHYSATGESWQSLNLAILANALGQQGRARAAADALRQADAVHDLRTALHRPELHQARAWAFAAAGNVVRAKSAARDGVDEALRTGQFAQALLVFHDGVRLGDSARIRRLATAAAKVDCALGPMILAHARGLASKDGGGLISVATQLESAGMLSAAADAAAQAASVFAGRGAEDEENMARREALRLRQRCAGLATPALQAVFRPSLLTAREREIALMVADGQSNRAIAQQLSLSVRTVEAHVARARAKLNVANRIILGKVVAATDGA